MTQETVFTFTDTDKEKMEKLIRLLPEKEFLGDFFNSLEMSTVYSSKYNEKLVTVINLSKGTFSTFENNTINENYNRFNIVLSELYSFLLKSFSPNRKDANRLDFYYELKHGTDIQRKKWDTEYRMLKFLISNTENTYKDLLNTVKNELAQKQTRKVSTEIEPRKIIKIEVLEDKTENNRITIFINNDYLNKESFRRGINWGLMYELAKNQCVHFKKDFFDYFNSNKTNPLYSKKKFQITQILKVEGKTIIPNIEIKTVTQKAVTQRLKSA